MLIQSCMVHVELDKVAVGQAFFRVLVSSVSYSADAPNPYLTILRAYEMQKLRMCIQHSRLQQTIIVKTFIIYNSCILQH